MIGGGMGSPSMLTKDGEKALQQCNPVFAFDRMAELLSSVRPDIKKCSYDQLVPLIRSAESRQIGVLVSGDVGFFSLAKKINETVDDEFEIINICGINSLQYLCAKLQLPYEGMNIISLHGRDSAFSLLGGIAYNPFTFVLTGGQNNASDILDFLSGKISCNIKVTAAESLSMESERIVSGSVNELKGLKFGPLTVLLFENKDYKKQCRPFFDEDFIRGKVPMTKQEIRWTSVNYMDISPGDIIFDIGAGTGSVALEMAARAHSGVVYAIEKFGEAVGLISLNKEKHGAYNVIAVPGNAASCIDNLPVPDKAFIGGSGNELAEIIRLLLNRNPGIRIVVNAIALETLSETLTVLKGFDFEYKVCCINASNSARRGDYNLMMANNPVYIIAGNRV